MTRRRRWIIVMGGLATVLVVTAGVLREVSYTGRLPREMAARMPPHWRIPWGLDADVRQGIEGLYSADTHRRAAAAESLADLGPRAAPAVPFLMAAMADVPPQPTDPGPPAAPPPLWTRIADYLFGEPPEKKAGRPDEYACWSAADALAEVGEPAVEPLIAALKDPMSDVRFAAVAALGEIGDERAVDPLAAAPWPVPGNWETGHECLEANALAAIGGRGVDVLIERLGSKDHNIRRTVAYALRYCRGDCPRAAEALASVLADPQADEAYVAADSLGHFRGDRARQALMTAADSPSADVRLAAVWSLAESPGEEVVEFLLAVLARGRAPEAAAAASVLGAIGGPRATLPLIAWLGRCPAGKRCYTASALGKFRDRRAVPALLAVLDAADSETADRQAVIDALGEIGDPRAVPALEKALEANGRLFGVEAARALGRIGDARAVPALVKMMKGGVDTQRMTAGDALAAIGPPAVDALIEALQDGMTAWNAAKALGRIGDRRAFEPLLAITQGGNPWTRAAAARALGRLGDGRAYEPLVEMLRAAGPKKSVLAHAAAEGLGYLGDPRAAEPILAFINRFDMSATIELRLSDYTGVVLLSADHATESAPTADVFTGAALALVRLGDPRGLDVFNHARPRTTWDTLHAGGPLVLGPAGIKVFIAALADARSPVRHAAAVALVTEGSPEAVAAVVAAYPQLPAETRRLLLAEIVHHTRYPDVTAALAGFLATDRDRHMRAYAAEELRKRGDPAAVEALRRAAAEDPSRHVRRAAEESLRRILLHHPQ